MPALQNTLADKALPIDCSALTKEMICCARKQLNKQKQLEHKIRAETLKADQLEILYALFKKRCELEAVPDDWKEGCLIQLPKKGDLSMC